MEQNKSLLPRPVDALLVVAALAAVAFTAFRGFVSKQTQKPFACVEQEADVP